MRVTKLPIVKCRNHICKYKENCLRWISKSEEHNQLWLGTFLNKEGCEDYIKVKKGK